MANSTDYNEPVYWRLSLNKNILDLSSYGGVFGFHYNNSEDLKTQWVNEPVVIMKVFFVVLLFHPHFYELREVIIFINDISVKYTHVDALKLIKLCMMLHTNTFFLLVNIVFMFLMLRKIWKPRFSTLT